MWNIELHSDHFDILFAHNRGTFTFLCEGLFQLLMYFAETFKLWSAQYFKPSKSCFYCRQILLKKRRQNLIKLQLSFYRFDPLWVFRFYRCCYYPLWRCYLNLFFVVIVCGGDGKPARLRMFYRVVVIPLCSSDRRRGL